MNLEDVAGVWWYILITVTIFCSSSPFFETPLDANFKKRTLKICNKLIFNQSTAVCLKKNS